MDRRLFLGVTSVASAAPVLAKPRGNGLPEYQTVTQARPTGAGMPGPYKGTVIKTVSDQCIDAKTSEVNRPVVKRMISEGMRKLTQKSSDREAWASFFEPHDVVGIKLNCSGAPKIRSSPEIVAEIVENLVAVGVPAKNIWLYERFLGQLESVHYERYVPAGVHIEAVEKDRGSVLGYDPKTYVEVDFFGEEDTRSNLVRLVSETFTKIINVPNMKDHGAAGVTGCLKNIAYGNFSNVARSHFREKTNTLSFIGTLASVEPLKSKTVLHVMDGLRGIWHGGPFLKNDRFSFFPKQIWMGTDPVAMDRHLIDVIESKRKAEGAVSVFDRSPATIHRGDELNPNVNAFIREPGHIEYAGKLGLGVFEKSQIREETIRL